MKHLILFALGIILALVGIFDILNIGIFGLLLTIPGGYLIGRYARLAWDYWKRTNPNYVPKPDSEPPSAYRYKFKYDNHGAPSGQCKTHIHNEKICACQSKVAPKEETLEEMLERLNIKFKIDFIKVADEIKKKGG